jgi:hypothetical protein
MPVNKKAILIFDPDRRPEQMEFVTARTEILHESGNQAWVAIDDGLAERFAAQGILVQFHLAADWIETPAIIFDPLSGEPQPPADLAAQPPTGGATVYAIVQFIAQPHADWISSIQELGAIFVQNMPSHALVFRLNEAQLQAARTLSYVRWVGLYHPAYALAFTLAGRTEPFTPVDLANLQIKPLQDIDGDRVTLEVMFFDDPLIEDRQAAVQMVGATLRTDTDYCLIVDIALARVRDLLRVAGVYVIEQHRPADVHNYRAIAITQVTQVGQYRNPGFLIALDGAGEIVGVIDTGLDNGVVTHPDLVGRVLSLTNMNNPPPPALPFSTADGQPNPQSGGRNLHGTHVTGTIAGNGAQSNGKVHGVAPAARIVFQSVNDPTLPPAAPPPAPPPTTSGFNF